MSVPGPALALLELESIARGIVVADAVVKQATVDLCWPSAVTPGKYLLVFSGGVAEVEEAFAAGKATAGATLLDSLLLPHPARELADALGGKVATDWDESVGIVETHTVAATLLGADAACKRAEVRVLAAAPREGDRRQGLLHAHRRAPHARGRARGRRRGGARRTCWSRPS